MYIDITNTVYEGCLSVHRSGSIGVDEAQDDPRLLRQEHRPEGPSVQEQSGLLLRLCSFPWDLFGWELPGKLFALTLGACGMLSKSLYFELDGEPFLILSRPPISQAFTFLAPVWLSGWEIYTYGCR